MNWAFVRSINRVEWMWVGPGVNEGYPTVQRNFAERYFDEKYPFLPVEYSEQKPDFEDWHCDV